MTKTRGQHNQAAGQTAQQGTSTGPAAPPVVSSPTPSAPSVLTTTNVTNPVCTSPADLLSLVTADTATISEEGKTIVNTIVKAVQILINQKDQTIEKMQNHIVQLENKIAELENETEEVNLYERRDTLIISGPNLPVEEQNENTTEKKTIRTIKDNLHINIENKDINVAHRLGSRNTQNSIRPIIVKLHSRQQKYDIMSACVTVKPNLYINESLTPKRRLLFKKVWDIRKQHRQIFQQCYTQDGRIYVKLRISNQKHVITTEAALTDFLDKYSALKGVTTT